MEPGDCNRQRNCKYIEINGKGHCSEKAENQCKLGYHREDCEQMAESCGWDQFKQECRQLRVTPLQIQESIADKQKRQQILSAAIDDNDQLSAGDRDEL